MIFILFLVKAPLDDNLISNTELGKLKLEYVIKKAVFLAPKVYCLVTESDKFIYKVKGLTHNINLNMTDFEHLLIKNNSMYYE